MGMTENMRKKAARLAAAVGVLFAAVPWLLSPAAQETAQASSIRLTALEGKVSVAAQGGKAVAAFENMRVLNGYSVETGQESYAGFSLDDEKAAKLDALSSAEVRKKGKKLELLLSEGSVFCDIKEPLEQDETMNIRTSTMITGIRGTVLYAKVVDQNTSAVFVLEGNVALQGIDPVTGQMTSVSVGTGQKGVAAAGTGGVSGPGVPAVRAYVEPFSKEEIDGYVLTQVAADPELAGRLEAAGWDTRWMADNAAGRLEEDQRRAAQELERLEQLGGAGEKTVSDQVYGDEDSDSGSGEREARRTVTMAMPVTAQEIAAQLEGADVTVIQETGEAWPGNLTLDCDISVPPGGKLEIGAGVPVYVESGSTLRVDGTMRTAESLSGSGTVINTGAHTLDIGGDFSMSGILENTGKLQVAGNLIAEEGSFRNAGAGTISVRGDMILAQAEPDLGGDAIRVEGNLTFWVWQGEPCVLGNNLEVSGALELQGGIFKIKGGVYRGGAVVDGVLEMSGGSLLSGRADCAIEDVSMAEIRLLGGRVLAQSGAQAAVMMGGGELSVQANVLRVEEPWTTAFVAGSGTLKLPGSGSLQIEDLEDGDLEAVEGADGWELSVFSPAVRRAEAGRRSGGDDPEVRESERPPVSSPSEAKPEPEPPSEDGETQDGQETPPTHIPDIPLASPSNAG